MNHERLTMAAHSSLIAIGVIVTLAALREAAAVIITVLVSILAVIALDPIVKYLNKRLHFHRSIGSLLVVCMTVGILYGLAYASYVRGRMLIADLPNIALKIQESPALKQIAERTQSLSDTANGIYRKIAPAPPDPVGPADGRGPDIKVILEDKKDLLPARLLHGLGTFSGMAFFTGFLPFLIYFILAGKETLTEKMSVLFGNGHKENVLKTIERIEYSMRKFLIGNLMVTGIVCTLTAVIFWLLRLPYGGLLGILSGILSAIPYLGAVLALLPGILVGLVVYNTPAPFIIMVIVISVLHFVAIHLLTPMLIGGGMRLNTVSATVAVMFFGWLWGGAGLFLGIPILGILKNIFDGIPSTKTIGNFIGDDKDLMHSFSMEPLESSSDLVR